MDKHQLTIELEAWMHGAIASQAQELGCTESEVIQQALKLMLGMDEPSLSKIIDKKIDEKLKDFELQLEEKLAKRLQELSSDRPKSELKSIPTTSATVRALQIGDLVQIRDQSSPYFLEKQPITKVGMLMASVQTSDGEQSFLKRDLRFIETSIMNSES